MNCIMVCFHKYQPWGGEYYQPIFDSFIERMAKYIDEYDRICFIDSTWNFTDADLEKIKTVKGGVVKVNPSLRYYDAYKEVIPGIEQELVLLMDNDMMVYRKGIIKDTFDKLQQLSKDYTQGKVFEYDVVTIYDSIGEYKTDKLRGRNKFCPYWFAAPKELLMKYLDIDWGPNMPHSETLGKLTEAMLNDGVVPFEQPEDKSDICMEGSILLRRPLESPKYGYYHIRSGSVGALLLAYRDHQPEDYWKYIREQPKREYLRQIAWYWYMGGDKTQINLMLKDMEVIPEDWERYIDAFYLYHGLEK